MWRRSRPCESHAHDTYESDKSYEPCDFDDPDKCYELCATYQSYEPGEFCDNDFCDPNESHKHGDSGQYAVTTSVGVVRG